MNECFDFYKNIDEYRITLGQVNFNLKNSNFKESMGLKLSISVSNIEMDGENNMLKLAISTNILACEKEDEDDIFFNIEIIYLLNFDISKEIDIEDKYISNSIKDYALRLLHPELRSMANSIINRVGLPNIDISLKAMRNHDDKN